MKLSPAFDAKVRKRDERMKASPSAGPDDRGPADDRACLLVVDDEPEITRSVAELLQRDHRVLEANSTAEALVLLEDNTVSVILTDQRMPNGTGAELLARCLDIAPEVTRILFTGYSDISAVIEAVNKGQIYYYLAKPWKPEELQIVLSQGLERYRLVTHNRVLLDELTEANRELEERVRERTKRLKRQNTALREARQRIEVLSRKDPLTGLANRGWFDETLALEVERSRRYGSHLSLVMGDLDHFKNVNDTFGHLVGDKVLQATASVLQGAVRMTDLVGRYGAEASVLAGRLREGVEQIPVWFRPEPVTGSFGVVEWETGEKVVDLVHRADTALYKAKRQGRNRVICDSSAEEQE
jgi:two-component system cell cycle response regulator